MTGGMIGDGRHFTPGKGIDGGKNVTGYPFGDNPFTFEAWFRAEAADSYVIYYGRYATRLNGKTGDGNEVGISVGSPPRLGWASDGPGGAGAETVPVLGQWYHVAATYENGTSQIFVKRRSFPRKRAYRPHAASSLALGWLVAPVGPQFVDSL